jgi:micrococcal nuclease
VADFREWRGLPKVGRRLRSLDEMPVRSSWHGANSPLNSRRSRKSIWSVEVILTIILGVSLGLVVALYPLTSKAPISVMQSPTAISGTARMFALCHVGGGTNCVVDGDTFWMDGQKIRIADIDTPETHPPRCPEEATLGAQATQRLQALLNAGPVTLESIERDTDKYGRALRIVTRDGQSLGAVLVAEGLARSWDGARHPWCA